MDEIGFDELFAIRIQYQDYILDEYTIIKRLKLLLVQNHNFTVEEANTFLVNFYNTYLPDFQMTSEIINTIQINLPLNNIFTQILNNISTSINNQSIPEEDGHNNENSDEHSDEHPDEHPDEHIDENPDENIIPNIPNSNTYTFEYSIPINTLSNILGPNLYNLLDINSNINQTEENLEDVLVTLDDECLDNMKTIKLEQDLDDKCSICMLDFNEDNEIYDLKCKHTFHVACMKQYLENYGYQCPVCRTELGKTKVHS
uniref:Ring finger domain protein n=1 Tax=Megaviridae environmental sample TaxID=1737588 RepID=A0A5J6VLY5_9VIRU|nr:MAG: ring finger domain protein [Megaviridae environmental sample]